jgi:hypothetical protein
MRIEDHQRKSIPSPQSSPRVAGRGRRILSCTSAVPFKFREKSLQGAALLLHFHGIEHRLRAVYFSSKKTTNL